MSRGRVGRDEARLAARRERASQQCDRIAELLDIDPESVYYDTDGVLLTPSVADLVIAALARATGGHDERDRCRGCGEHIADAHAPGCPSAAAS